MELVARLDRTTGDFNLFRDRAQFGHFANCECAHVFESQDEELEELVNNRLEGGMDLREMLGVVRESVEYLDETRRRENEAERHSENAWLRATEYDPEALAEMYRDDARGAL